MRTIISKLTTKFGKLAEQVADRMGLVTFQTTLVRHSRGKTRYYQSTFPRTRNCYNVINMLPIILFINKLTSPQPMPTENEYSSAYPPAYSTTYPRADNKIYVHHYPAKE